MVKNSKRKRWPAGEETGSVKIQNDDAPTTTAVESPSSLSSSKVSVVDNPLLTAQSKYLSSVPSKIKNHFFSENHVDGETRAEIWSQQADIGEDLVNKYAWATPDDRAIKILRQFSPIVEVGCGANCYWAKMMNDAGIDVMAYDVEVDDGGKISFGNSGESEKKGKRAQHRHHQDDEEATRFPIRRGGPDVLSSDPICTSGRALFLCYPDENDYDAAAADPSGDTDQQRPSGPPVSMGAECLEHFQGDIVIHVGELHGDALSMDQAPWGRSSAPEFQKRLAAEYHCLLKASLPGWLHVRDTISVWKRSDILTMTFEGDSDDEDDEDEEIEYKYIPPEERFPTDIAAPALQHLLTD